LGRWGQQEEGARCAEVVTHGRLQARRVQGLPLEGEEGSVSLSRSERVYVSFVVDHEFPKFPRTKEVVPPDVGIEKSLVTSDGAQPET